MSLAVQGSRRVRARTFDRAPVVIASEFVAIFLQVLVVSAFWGSWLGLSRSIDTLSPATFAEVGHVMMADYGPTMSVLMPVTVLATLVAAVLVYRQRRSAGYLLLLGFLGTIAATAVTLIVNVPIDVMMADWTAATLPPNWQQIRDHWETYHALRTFISLGGLAATLAGSLLPAERVGR